MRNLDDVITPYATTKPENAYLNSTMIERIPMIVDSNGQFEPAFLKFYNDVLYCLLSEDWNGLWTYSDKSMEIDEFYEYAQATLRNPLHEILNMDKASFGIDMEVDFSIFKKLHRNLIGSFNLMMYKISESVNDVTDKKVRNLVLYTNSLKFTYKENEFKIISVFNQAESIE